MNPSASKTVLLPDVSHDDILPEEDNPPLPRLGIHFLCPAQPNDQVLSMCPSSHLESHFNNSRIKLPAGDSRAARWCEDESSCISLHYECWKLRLSACDGTRDMMEIEMNK